jgi:hypothetical protein
MRRCLVMVVGVLLLTTACRDPYTQVRIVPAATIAQGWSEIRPAEPLRWTKPIQDFSFHIDTPHERSSRGEIVGLDGQSCIPEVEFLTTDGKTLVADTHGFWGEEMYFYWSKGGIGTEAIQAIRVRSSLPLQISNLIWRGYDPAEVKR